MRIISGKLKGKKLIEPKDKATRPLKDLTKESIFNIILHSKKFNVDIINSNVLDLFSGVGSFGLECLSRGSSFSTFVENYREVIPILKKNITNLSLKDNYSLIEKNIFNELNFELFKKKFDIIFMDPPFKENDLLLVLNKIIQAEILNQQGIIIIHRHKKEKDKFPDQFKIIEKKIYGVSKIFFGKFV